MLNAKERSGSFLECFWDEHQMRVLQKLFDQCTRAERSGKPGMLLAQVFPDGLRVAFIPHDQAMEIIELRAKQNGEDVAQAKTKRVRTAL